MKRIHVVVCALAVTSACSLDLAIPESPKRGGLTGRVDTQGHVSPLNLEVALVADDNTRSTQKTDALGAFTFGDLAPGTYFLDLQIPGFATFVRPGIRVSAGQQYDVGALAPTWLQNTPNAATVTGKLVIEGGAGDTNGAQVEFVLEGVNQTVALAAVTSSGKFVQRVPPGMYTLRASHPLFVTQVMSALSVGEGESKDLSAQPIVMALNPATVTGKLLKEVDGLPAVAAAGALVTYEGNGVTTTTDVTGAFLLGGLPGGASTVRYALAGFHDAVLSRAVKLVPGEASTLPDVTLALDRGDVVGEVRTADGQPIQDATISVPGSGYVTQVVPDPANAARGTFQLRGLPVGSYSLRAVKARYIAAVSANVTVVSGQATALSAPLTLAVQQGDFEIDDGDVTNSAGYTRALQVTLKLSFAAAVTYRASEDPTFTGVAFVPFTGSNQPFTLAATQGTHVVYVQFEDANSTRSATFSSAVVLDSVAPTNPLIVINGGAGFTNQASPFALTLTASDVPGSSADTVSGLGLVKLSMTAPVGGVLTATSVAYLRDLPFVPSTLTDGPKTVYAQFIDNAGNASAVVSATVVVDTQPPTAASLQILRGAKAAIDGYTDSALVTLQVSAATEPNGGAVSVRLGNSTAALALATFSPLQQDVGWFLDPSTQGTKTVSAEFRDSAGNLAVVQTASIIYDTLAPSPVTLLTVGSLTVTNDAGVGLSVSAVDTNGLSPTGFTLSEDPGFQGGNLGPQALPSGGLVTFTLGAGDGTHRIFARFRDLAGNDATASVAVTLDTTAPTGSVEATGSLADGVASSTRTATTAITANINANGASLYLLGADALTVCPTQRSSYTALPVVTSGLAAVLDATPGTRQVNLCLRDEAGNVAGPFSDSLILDSAAPTGCTVSLQGKLADGIGNAPAGQTAKSQVSATVQGCSADVIEYFLVNGTVSCSASLVANWSAFAAPSTAQVFSLTSGDGPNAVAGCYRDASHNVAALASTSITLDTTAPSALGVTLNDGAPYLGQGQLDGGQPVAKVTGVAVGATQWALSETDPTAFTTFTGAPAFMTLSGSGTKTVYARFRDDLGNLSGVVTSSITVDTTSPSVVGARVSIDTVDGGVYVKSTSVTLSVTPPSDAVQTQIVERAATGACVPTDYASSGVLNTASNYVYSLSGGDGQKRVCVRWFDAAGNPSSSVFDTKTLDTAPPSQPFVLASDRVFNPNLTGESSSSWISIVNASDPQHFDWQVLGGLATQWQSTTASLPGAGTPGCTSGLCLRAQLSISASAESGTQNILRVREIDAAGNASGEGTVVLTTDIVAPRPVALSLFWVDNRSSAGIVRWQPLDGGSPDTVAHRIYYGAAPGTPATNPPTDYNGFNATEGASPIEVGNTSSATLSGLANGSLAYLTVRPVDRAGNLGAVATGSPEIVLQPNELSPTHLSTLSLMTDAGATGGASGTSVEVVGDMAYVFAGFSGGRSVIAPVGLASIVSPTQGGVVGAGAAPISYVPVTSTDGQSIGSRPGAMVAEPPYLFVTAGNFFRVWSIVVPAAPTLVTSIDLSAFLSGPLNLTAIDVRGATAFVVGYSTTEVLFAIDVASLYDNNSATVPTAASVRSSVAASNLWIPQGIFWTRDRLYFGNGNGGTSIWDLTNALDASTLTTLTYPGSRITAGIGWSLSRFRGAFSGNVAVVSEPTALRLLDITTTWTSVSPYFAEISRTPLVARGQYEVWGDQFFVSESNYSGVQTASLFDMVHPTDTGAVRPSGSATTTNGLAVYGNYALQTTDSSPSMRLYELATPRALRRHLSIGFPSGRPNVLPGFIVGASGMVIDQFSSAARLVSPISTEACVFDGVVFDDTLISTRWSWNGSSYNGEFRVTELDTYLGRTASPGTVTANSTNVAAPALTRFTGVDRLGNYLVVVSIRPGSPSGSAFWVEVYRANGLRSRATGAARTFSLGDKVTEFQFDTSPRVYDNTSGAGSGVTMSIRMNGTRAVISHGSPWNVSSAGAYLLDLAPMLDDNAATTMSASNVLAKLTKTTAETFGWSSTDGVLKGNFLYFAGNGDLGRGLYVYNAADAFDGNALTVLDGDDRIAFEPQSGANSIDVAGAYAVVTGATGAATISSYDISVPSAPKLLSETAYAGNTGGHPCFGDMGTTTHIRGSKVYVGSYERLDVVDLE